ncbi:MAG: glycosyltransferase family 4 protein [Sphingomicrobium sp.]
MLEADAVGVRDTDWDSRAPSRPPFGRIALIGNALPRNCGLATFTSHLSDALAVRYPALTLDHYAMDDASGVTYPNAITTIHADERDAYRKAARAIADSGAEAVWLQHEFGIFGGEAGAYILDLIEDVRLPLAVTVHTVLETPSMAELEVFRRLLARADLLIVMAESGAATLRRRYGVDPRRIMVIPHGVPDRPLVAPDSLKARFGLEGRTVLMTFGLLAPDKGIAHMIEAMPAIVAAHPDALYLVVGATHPNLLRHDHDAYRHSLEERVTELGMSDHVRFDNRFVEQEELLDLLQASDVYVTPYLNMAQVTSGTLSYAAAVGKPIVSTPYVHAAELLADGRGVLVDPGSNEALASAIGKLLDEPERREALSRAIYHNARAMLWPRVAERALEAMAARRGAVRAPANDRRIDASEALALSLEGVERMSDGTGMLQHSIHGIPDRDHGYCIDDNARALLLAVLRRDDPRAARLAYTYAAFVQGAWNPDTRRFRNFMGFDRRWLEDAGSEDSNGRTLWALGVAGLKAVDRSMKAWARELYELAVDAMDPLHSPRAQAFAALGAIARIEHEPAHQPSLGAIERAGATMDMLHRRFARDGWDWYEPVLAYDNARLCEAHIRAGMALGRPDWVETGVRTLGWIESIQRGARGQFRPVGSESFGHRYAPPAAFDQQPLEASAMIDAAAAALKATGDARWHETAAAAFGWFVGDNEAGVPLAIPEHGSCYDGLMRHGINRNQGAESILSLHLAAIAMRTLSLRQKAATRTPVPA